MIIFKCMARKMKAEKIWAPGVIVSDGIAYDYAQKHKLCKPVHDFDADVISAARNLSARYMSYSPHIDALTQMATLIFDTMKKIHGLGKRERLLLQVAAILHDCGKYISLANGPLCSYDIIMASEIIGLTHMEREIVAYTVLYNTYPLPAYEDFESDISRESYVVIAKLSAILRVSNAMDRSHKQKFKNVRAAVKGKELVITIETDDDIALEKALFDAKVSYFENIFMRPGYTSGDLSAVVTGIILALNVPVGMPIGELLIGDFVAIIVVKQLFGGIGMNFANPALVGRIVLFISFAGAMNKWVFPDAAVDQLSSATPLAVADPNKLSLLDLFMGVHGGVLGETCALAIVLGLIYLVVTKTISIAIPAAYVGSMFLFYLIATHSVHAALVAVLSGGLLFGAVFMATDYVTSPFTLKGKLIYGVALGIVTFAIRYWGSYTEGVSFALLFMNLWVPYINDMTRQTPYGYVKPAKKEAAGK